MLPKKLSAAKGFTFPQKSSPDRERGFTLIEILVVIGILAILLTIVLVAINPTKNTQDARNTKRRSDVLTILNAVNQYYVAVGAFPTGTPIDGGPTVDIKNAAGCVPGTDCTGPVFCTQLVTTYVAQLPVDPSLAGSGGTDCVAAYDTGYTITQVAAGRIKITAPSAEAAVTISVTR